MNTNDDIIRFTKYKEYKFIRYLGNGATGETILLLDNSIDEYFVCKKYVPCNINYKEEWYKRFVEEIKTLYKMNHPKIVRVFNYHLYNDARTGYIIMEYINGLTINNYVLSYPEQFDNIFLQAVEGFAYLESQGILHRDIRYSNIMVTNEGDLKIIDFGFSKELGSYDTNNSVSLNWIATVPSEMTGKTKIYNEKTEVYFVGRLFNNILNESNAQTNYIDVIEKMCKHKEYERYQSFNDVINEISRHRYKKISPEDKAIFQDFANILCNLIASLDQDALYIKDTNIVTDKMRELLNISQLEDVLQNKYRLSNCFIDGFYSINNYFDIKIDNINRFYEWWCNKPDDIKKLSLRTLWERFDTISRCYDLPF
ncbi:MAG: protein kinase family protein [Alphaproteobacteria bacterium]|nr:protein kinase family protein [Alphaproteobacteria bacterium]